MFDLITVLGSITDILVTEIKVRWATFSNYTALHRLRRHYKPYLMFLVAH